MPLQEERNLLMVVFKLRMVFMLHQQTRVSQEWLKSVIFKML
jgi:hypothetical protein